MADYDASIRVGTKINTDTLKEAQKEFDTLQKKLDKLYEKGDKLEALGVDKQSRQWKSLQYDVAKTEVALEDAAEKLKGLNDAAEASRPKMDLIDKDEKKDVEDVAEGFKEARKSSERFFSATQGGAKESNGLIKKLVSGVKKIAIATLIFNGIRKGFNSMVSAAKEGFTNLAKYSKTYNASMSALKSECAQLKNGLAATFEPVANLILPYITKLVSWLNTAADTVSRFLAAISGKSTYTRAKKQVLDYAKSLDTASNAAKGALASFDSLNVLASESATGSGGGEVSGADAFEEVEVGNSMQGILDALKPFQESIENWINNLNFEPIITAFNNLKTAVAPFAGYLLDGLQFFLDRILLPLGSWVIEDALPAFFDLLSAALDALNTVWVITQPYLEWLWNNFLEPAAAWVGDAIVDGLKAITEKLRDFSDWAMANEENMSLISSIILGLFAGIVFYYSAKGIVGMINAIKDAMGLFSITSLLAAGNIMLAAVAIGVMAAAIIYLAQNWDKLSDAQKVITILGGLAAAAIAAAVAIAIFHTAWSVGVAAAAIVGGLVTLGLTAACLKWNGSSTDPSDANSFYSSNNFNGSPLPALATGGITTRPTTALIGEAGREAVLPLENNTEWMDVLADRINPNITIRFGGSLSELGRVLKPVIDAENARVGTSYKI